MSLCSCIAKGLCADDNGWCKQEGCFMCCTVPWSIAVLTLLLSVDMFDIRSSLEPWTTTGWKKRKLCYLSDINCYIQNTCFTFLSSKLEETLWQSPWLNIQSLQLLSQTDSTLFALVCITSKLSVWKDMCTHQSFSNAESKNLTSLKGLATLSYALV